MSTSINWRTKTLISVNQRTKLFFEELNYISVTVQTSNVAGIQREFLGVAHVLAMQEHMKVLLHVTSGSHYEMRRTWLAEVLSNDKKNSAILEWLKGDELWLIGWLEPSKEKPIFTPRIEPMYPQGVTSRKANIDFIIAEIDGRRSPDEIQERIR